MSGYENQKKAGGRPALSGRRDSRVPQNLEAEQGVLGCILLAPQSGVAEAVERLRMGAEAFYDLRHQMIFEAMAKLWSDGKAVDLITLMELLRNQGTVEQVGLAYLSELPEKAPSAANLAYYLEIVREKYFLRKAMQISAGVIANVSQYEGDLDEFLNAFERDWFRLSQERYAGKEVDWPSALLQAVAAMEDYHRGGAQLQGLSTGFDYLDKMTCGLVPPDMIVLAGRPSTGKTSLAFNIVEHVAARCNVPVGVFSLEMSGKQLAMRSIFQWARADLQRFRTGFFQHKDFPPLLEAVAKLRQAPVSLDESGDVRIAEIRAKSRRWVSERKVRLIVIDYLQLVKGSKDYRDKKDEVSEVSNQIKRMAKELEVPVIALCQLNRDIEKDQKRRPMLSDLRDSGEIEQDADLVGILHYPKLTKEEQEAMDEQRDWAAHSRRVNLEICKQRNGPTGKVEFLFQKSCMRFFGYKRTALQMEEGEL